MGERPYKSEADCEQQATGKSRGRWYCEELLDIAEDMDWDPAEDGVDGSRPLVRVARDKDQQDHQIKPDSKTHPHVAFGA
jgi:hypothetical protein